MLNIIIISIIDPYINIFWIHEFANILHKNIINIHIQQKIFYKIFSLMKSI